MLTVRWHQLGWSVHDLFVPTVWLCVKEVRVRARGGCVIAMGRYGQIRGVRGRSKQCKGRRKSTTRFQHLCYTAPTYSTYGGEEVWYRRADGGGWQLSLMPVCVLVFRRPLHSYSRLPVVFHIAHERVKHHLSATAATTATAAAASRSFFTRHPFVPLSDRRELLFGGVRSGLYPCSAMERCGGGSMRRWSNERASGVTRASEYILWTTKYLRHVCEDGQCVGLKPRPYTS